MNWEDIIKVQITNVKQDIKTSSRKLPEEDEEDCNKILHDKFIKIRLEVKRFMELESRGKFLIKYKPQGMEYGYMKRPFMHPENIDGPDVFYPLKMEFRDSSDGFGLFITDPEGKSGQEDIKILSFNARFIPYKSQENACAILEQVRLGISTEIYNPMYALIDLDWEGRYNDIVIQASENSVPYFTRTVNGKPTGNPGLYITLYTKKFEEPFWLRSLKNKDIRWGLITTDNEIPREIPIRMIKVLTDSWVQGIKKDLIYKIISILKQ